MYTLYVHTANMKVANYFRRSASRLDNVTNTLAAL